MSKQSEEVLLSGLGSVLSLVLSCGVTIAIVVIDFSAAFFLAVANRALCNVVTVVLFLVSAAALLVRDLAILSLHSSLADAAFNHIVVGLL